MEQDLQAVWAVRAYQFPVILNSDEARNDIANLEAGIGKDPMVEHGIVTDENVSISRDAVDPVASDYRLLRVTHTGESALLL